jgi:hypothetical protein
MRLARQADSRAVLRGHRPSYREALLYLRDHLAVKCPSGLATAVRARRPNSFWNITNTRYMSAPARPAQPDRRTIRT